MSQDRPWPEHLAGLLPPDKILKGQYEITGFLGEGGFGAVFAGVQHPLDRPVAVKVMFPGHSPQVRERFLREAQAAAGLRHPNVVTVFDYGLIDQRRPYIVMELLDGSDLGFELRERGALERGRALSLFMPCLEALFEAHERGLVHRDIKPENLFLTALPRGREVLRLLDFGIARMIDVEVDDQITPSAAARLTPTGQKVGTPHYLSPEYFESGTVTPALDVYAMGLVLAEMLTGAPVVQANNLYGYVIRHIRGDLAFDEALTDDPIMPVLRRATAKRLEERYPDAGAFLEALEGLEEARSPVLIHSSTFSTGSVSGAMSRAQQLIQAHSPTRPIPDGFVYVRPERFIMGSGPREPGRSDDEVQHVVSLTRGYLIQTKPVTQAEWRKLMGNDPSFFEGEDRPVEQVNWYDALAFCNALSERDGLEACYRLVDARGRPGEQFVCKKAIFKGLESDGYRLPTEAEWEFAARAGITEARYGALTETSWYDNNSRRKTQPVGQKEANAWGLYDTLGNVWEWVWDRYEPTPPEEEIDPVGPFEGVTRVQRGGCYNSASKLCRLGNRGHSPPFRHFRTTGFRVARTYT